MNISIAPNNNDSNTTDYSEFKDYIIKNNLSLTDENKKLREKIIEIEKENLEMENYDEKIRYMRGLLHNLYELKEKSLKICKTYVEFSKNILYLINKVKKLESLLNKLVLSYILGNLIYILFCLNNYYVVLTIIKNNLYIISIFIGYYKFIVPKDTIKLYFTFLKGLEINIEYLETIKNQYKELTDRYKEREKEIIDLERGCASVSVMIDNI